MLHDEEDCRERFRQRQGFFRVHLHEHFARFAAGDGLSVFENLFIEEERVRQEDHLVGIQRLGHQKFLRIAAGLELICQIRHVGGINTGGHFTHGDLGERRAGQAEHAGQPFVCIGVDGKRGIRVIVMDDNAVVLHENDGRNLAGFFFYAAQFIPNGEGQVCTGIGVGHPAPGVIGSRECLCRDWTAGCGTGGEIGIDAVRVHHEGLEDGMEARLDRRTQVGKTVNMAHVGLCAGGALFFNVRKRRRIGCQIEIPQISPVQHGISLIRTDIGQTEAGGLDRHQPAGQLDGGVASAALHIVGACARRLGNAGEIGKQLCVFFKKHSHSPLTACSARRPRSA